MAPYIDLPTPPADADFDESWRTRPLVTSAIPDKGGTDESVTIALGGSDKWIYNLQTGLFDITRNSDRVLTLLNTSRDEELHHHKGVQINPAKTCLVVVDMQNYFIHPAWHAHPGLSAVEPITQSVQKCRELGIQVAWLNWVIDERDMISMPPAVQRCFNAQRALQTGNGWGVNLGSEVPDSLGGGRVLWEGSWNADIYQPLKDLMQPQDAMCYKNRMSGMWHPTESLHRFLTTGGFQTLIFTGINTDMCLLSTMTDAHSSGFDVVMLRDATGTATKVKGAQELVEHNVAACMGFVLDTEAFVTAEETYTRHC